MRSLVGRVLGALGAGLLLLPGRVLAADFDLLPPPEGADFSPYQMTVPLASPLEKLTVSSPFGWRFHPISGELNFHTGLDLAGKSGTPIRAVMAGEVVCATFDESYGNYLILDHGSGFSTLYAHCSKLLVREGDRVKRGEMIARMGATGEATGPHLHLEIRMEGVRLDPAWGLGLPDD